MLRGRYSACFVTWIGGGDGNCLDERYNYGPTSCLGSRCNYVSLNLGAILIEGEEGGGGRRAGGGQKFLRVPVGGTFSPRDI